MHPKSVTYVMRLWESECHGDPVWHASLHDPHTEERRIFADLEGLFTFLKDKVDESSLEDQGDGPTLGGNPCLKTASGRTRNQ